MNNRELTEKRKRLAEILKGWDGLAVAFSGGVDSTFLLAMARKVLGDRVAAITADSPLQPRRETVAAAALARSMGVRHVVVPSGEMAVAEFTANPPNRCYLCKKVVMGEVLAAAARIGIHRVAHGAHMDDLGDYRPGLRAAVELGLEAPLMEARLNQAEIRELSRRMKLPTWRKPSMACLASRIPYGTPITVPVLGMVEAAEDFLRDLGLAHCRVRHHGPIARIEVARGAQARLLREPIRGKLLERLREIGFTHVAVDIEGYTMGSLNRSLPTTPKPTQRS